MKQYHDLCEHILKNGVIKGDRTGTGTISTFGYQMRFNLADGFPLLTTKKVFIKGIIHELIWFLNGDTDIKYLLDNGVNIWNGDAYRWFKALNPQRQWFDSVETQEWFIKFLKEHGLGFNLGPIYGKQWRSWSGDINDSGVIETIDQITKVIEQIKSNPDSRRLIVSAWNVGEIEKMALPPCHILFQFYVINGKLSCQLYQRSGDVFLGVPFNIASYALLTMMIADQCGLEYGEFIHTLGDAHIYLNHVEQVKLQLTRDFRPLPTMKINKKVKDIFSYKYEDFELDGYDPHPPIKGDVSVGK